MLKYIFCISLRWTVIIRTDKCDHIFVFRFLFFSLFHLHLMIPAKNTLSSLSKKIISYIYYAKRERQNIMISDISNSILKLFSRSNCADQITIYKINTEFNEQSTAFVRKMRYLSVYLNQFWFILLSYLILKLNTLVTNDLNSFRIKAK